MTSALALPDPQPATEVLPPRLAEDGRTVLTLDAGGTNFVFSALRGGRALGDALTLPSRADELGPCLDVLTEGFTRIREHAAARPAAISFAFPGPADYPAGIVGNARNLPAFLEPVALGPMLEDRFAVPVFINNDGDLFAYGEAIAGFLPWINGLLEQSGSARRYRNLFGVTVGTGFGGGFVHQGVLYTGDNAAASEICTIRNKLERSACAEEGVSIRAIRDEYARVAGVPLADSPEPRAIYEIARGERKGDVAAAREAFRRLGEVAGDALATVSTILDTSIAIGGGLTGAAAFFLPALVAEMNGRIHCAGADTRRTHLRAFNLEDEKDREIFLADHTREIEVPGSARRVRYDRLKRIAVGLSRLGASRAVAVGAYAFALDALDARVRQ